MKIHTVRYGENLWGISQRYQTTIDRIVKSNEISNPTQLVVGQALIIPTQYPVHVIQAGESLNLIAQRYKVTTEELLDANQIVKPALIYIGQPLTIPALYHTVQAGETIWKIAGIYKADANEIIKVNGITNPAFIYQGTVLRIPEKQRPVYEINAYTTRRDEAGSQEVRQLGKYFTYLTPFTYAIRNDGTINEINDLKVISAAYATNVKPLMVLTNFSGGKFNSDLAATILRNPKLQQTLLTNVMTKMKTKGYTGLSIDFEYVYPEDRENYNSFLKKIVDRLHKEGFSVSTALAPKTNQDQKGLLYEAHDYKAHGEIADFVILMTYEWGWAGGKPRAIAPINEVKKVLDYAVQVIPRKKIMLGMPLYGRDWKVPWIKGTFARTISPLEAVGLASAYRAAIQYDANAQSPYFKYIDESGQQHEVWFEDARSMQTKFRTMKEYGLRGASYWVLGNQFPQNWAVQQDQLKVKKL